MNGGSDNTRPPLFPQSVRLKGRKLIEVLHSGGTDFFLFPLRTKVIRIQQAENPGVQVLVNVSKKRFKHAVDRNRVKRLLREAIRLHFPEHLESEAQASQELLLIALHYIHQDLPPFQTIEKTWIKISQKINYHALAATRLD